MKLDGAAAARFCRSPDDQILGALVHGPDPALVESRARELVGAVLGPDADPTKLTQTDTARLRKDPAALDEAVRSIGLLPGRPVVQVNAGTDTLVPILSGLIDQMTVADGLIVISAGILPARSKLRALFESHKSLISLRFFDDSMDMAEVKVRLHDLGLRGGMTPDAEEAIHALAGDLDHGSFLKLLERLALYSMENDEPVDEADVAAIAPLTIDGELDSLIQSIGNGQTEALGPMMRRLSSGGLTPISMLIALQRHFRQLLLVASASTSRDAAMKQIRPPLWGQRRAAFESHLRKWPAERLESANRLLYETDRMLRSAGAPPELALVERCALRLALMAGR